MASSMRETAMTVWQCDLFADKALTLPCVRFVGRFTSVGSALEALKKELSAVQVLLYPGPISKIVDDGSYTDAAPFRMVRLSSAM